MERNEENDALKNFQTDTSQRMYHLNRSCPRCGLRIAIGAMIISSNEITLRLRNTSTNMSGLSKGEKRKKDHDSST
jgi:hypothetical protein